MNLQVIQQPVSGIAQSQVFRVSITNVPAAVHRWITAHPGQSALLITNGILIFTPAALTGPLLVTMGFGASGPVAGSIAAWLQSILGNVGAHSVLATGKPNPSSSNTTSHGGLYDPYKGRLGARQLSESVSSFLSRLPPSKSSRDEWGPWIFIANPYTSHPLACEDWAGFKTAGAELLSSFSTKKAEIEQQFAGNPQKVISQKLTLERKALEESICAAAKERNCTTGKWMLFPTSDNVDDVWEKVAIGTAEGQLGIASKVSTADVEMAYGGGVTSLVCVYTKDFIDKEDVKRVIVKLVELGLVGRSPVSYKCDAYTHLGIYSQNDWGLKASIYSSEDMLGRGELS